MDIYQPLNGLANAGSKADPPFCLDGIPLNQDFLAVCSLLCAYGEAQPQC